MRARFRSLRCLSGVALALALLATTTVAGADSRTEARTHFKRGMDLIAAQKFDDGVAELKQAYEILPHPNVLYNIGRAYAEKGDLEQAIAYYNKYLESNPNDKEEVTKIVAELETRTKKAREAPPAKEPTPPPVDQPDQPLSSPPVEPVAKPAPVQKGELGAVRTEDVFAETVVTASKGAQSPLDSQSSTSIITEQDIRLSGLTKIPELLRRLAGVDIMEVTGGQTEVSIRGFNQRLSNKVLVLVDGRSVYVDLLGATLWQALSIGVEDIQRIEVVRGPGSSLYGADAFAGVINIISKRPGEHGNGVVGGYGTQGQTHGSLWVSGRDGNFAYRASAGYDYLPRWSREVPNGRNDVTVGIADQVQSARTTRLDLRTTARLGKDVNFGLGGGLTQGTLEILGVGPLNDIVLPGLASSDVTTYIESKHVEARVFWNRVRTDSTLNVATLGQSLLPSRADQNVLDASAEYRGSVALTDTVKDELRFGANYRYKDVDWTYLAGHRIENHWGIFLHDELKLGHSVALVGDYRLDYVPYLSSFQQSPRGAVLIHPTKLSTIRLSVATAFRKPTFLESYLSLPFQLPASGGALVSEGERSDNPTFKVQPERVFTAELGYLTQDLDALTGEASIYVNRVTDLVQLASIRPLSVGDVANGLGGQSPQTGLFPLFFGGFSNQCQAYDVYGAEVGVRTFPVQGLDLYANYTLNLVRQDNASCSQEELALIVDDARTSQHKVNAGVQLRTKVGIDAAADVHFVTDQVWAEQVANFASQRIETQPFGISGYTLANVRVGYRFPGEHAEVSATAWNAFGVEHREHPFGQVVGRRAMAFFAYRF